MSGSPGETWDALTLRLEEASRQQALRGARIEALASQLTERPLVVCKRRELHSARKALEAADQRFREQLKRLAAIARETAEGPNVEEALARKAARIAGLEEELALARTANDQEKQRLAVQGAVLVNLKHQLSLTLAPPDDLTRLVLEGSSTLSAEQIQLGRQTAGTWGIGDMIRKAVSEHPNLQRLYVGDEVTASARGLKALGTALCRGYFTAFYLGDGVVLGDEGLEALANAFPYDMKHFVLGKGVTTGEGGLRDLAEVLKRGPLRTFILGDNTAATCKGLKALADGLCGCPQLQEWVLGDKVAAGDKQLTVLAAALSKSRKLEHFFLGHQMAATDAGLEALAEGLAGCPELARFRLDVTSATGAGLKALARALPVCPKLKQLSLGDRIAASDLGLEALAEGLIGCPELEYFCLDYAAQSATEDGLRALAGALPKCPKLKRLILADQIAATDAELQALARGLAACPELDFLHLGSTLYRIPPQSPQDAKDPARALPQGPQLRHFLLHKKVPTPFRLLEVVARACPKLQSFCLGHRLSVEALDLLITTMQGAPELLELTVHREYVLDVHKVTTLKENLRFLQTAKKISCCRCDCPTASMDEQLRLAEHGAEVEVKLPWSSPGQVIRDMQADLDAARDRQARLEAARDIEALHNALTQTLDDKSKQIAQQEANFSELKLLLRQDDSEKTQKAMIHCITCEFEETRKALEERRRQIDQNALLIASSARPSSQASRTQKEARLLDLTTRLKHVSEELAQNQRKRAEQEAAIAEVKAKLSRSPVAPTGLLRLVLEGNLTLSKEWTRFGLQVRASGRGAARLCEALCECPKLQCLRLGDRVAATDCGLVALSKVLPQCPDLVSFWIGDGIATSDAGLEALACALPSGMKYFMLGTNLEAEENELRGLAKLHLKFRRLRACASEGKTSASSHGLESVAEGLQECPELEQSEGRRKTAPHGDGVAAVSLALPGCPALTHFFVSHQVAATDEDLSALAQALIGCPLLESFYVRGHVASAGNVLKELVEVARDAPELEDLMVYSGVQFGWAEVATLKDHARFLRQARKIEFCRKKDPLAGSLSQQITLQVECAQKEVKLYL